MQLAMLGLGKMGANMTRRLVNGGHEVIACDIDPDVATALAAEHEAITAAATLDAMLAALPAPRVIWLMAPHQVVDDTLDKLLAAGLQAGDILIDGGNSNYKQSQQRARRLRQQAIHWLDCGTSGGVWGLQNGYSLMIGGDGEAVAHITPVLQTLAPSPDSGWGHVGPSGAGHYVKMIHNGIEYGMMQAFAEGFELMQNKPGMDLDTAAIARIWQQGSVVRSWLLDLIADALARDAGLSQLSDYVEDSGEGRWTVIDAVEQGIPAPVLSLALQMRFRSRQPDSYAGKVLNAMRAGFGGHPIRPADAGEGEDA